MTITPEEALDKLAEMAWQKSTQGYAHGWRDAVEESAAIDWAIARIAELEAQLADMRRDLSDARSGWEDAVAEVREMEAREQPAAECEAVEAVAYLLIDDRCADEHGDWDIEPIASACDHLAALGADKYQLMTVAQHERIVKQLAGGANENEPT